jgi:hypothetical protein
MNLEKILEKSITELSRAKRDLHNIVFRKLNNTAKEELRQEILGKIESVKNSTPISISVVESHEYIKYPEPEIIENITRHILAIHNISDKKISSLLEKNKEIQEQITVLAKLSVLNIEFISGEEHTYTLVAKVVEGDGSNATFVEYIPKKFASKIEDLQFFTDYEVIMEDPLISIDISENPEFAYLIKKRINLKEGEDIVSILVSEDTSLPSLKKISGFGVFGNLKPLFLQSSRKRLIIEIVVVVILVLIYLAYSFNLLKYIPLFSKEVKEIKASIRKGFEYVKQDKYEESKGMYKKVAIAFKKLPPRTRAKVKNDILDLCYAVDVTYIHLLLNQANSLAGKEHEKALRHYNHIKEIYKRIAPKYKAKVLQECTALHKKLSK